MKSYLQKKFELITWIAALVLLAWMPFGSGDFSFCPFHLLGFKFCPGCGLGRSVHLLFKGEFRQSFQMHPLGIPATSIIGYRILSLIRLNFSILKINSYEQ